MEVPLYEMPQQQVEGHVFPIQLEWLGGRSTFQKSHFSARNALICLEDMKESGQIIPVILEKRGNQVAFQVNNQTMINVLNLDDIVQVHCFPTDPSYAIFEINGHDGSARFEVVQAPGKESLKSIQDFLFTYDYVNPSPPVLPAQSNNDSTPPVPDAYEVQEKIQPATNGVSTPEFQTEEGYEEVAVNVADKILSQPSAEALSNLVENEAEGATEEVDKTRSSASSTPVFSDSHPYDRNAENAIGVPRSGNDSDKEDEAPCGQQGQQQQEKLNIIEISKPRKFGKLQPLTELIAEEGIDTKNYQDDGRLYLLSKKAPKHPKGRPSSFQTNGISEGLNPKKSTGTTRRTAIF